MGAIKNQNAITLLHLLDLLLSGKLDAILEHKVLEGYQLICNTCKVLEVRV